MKWGERRERVEVQILAVDLDRLERAATIDDVGAELGRRGRLVAAAGPPGPSGSKREHERSATTGGRELVWTAATSSVHRFSFATTRKRAGESTELERRAYEEKLALDRDVVPRLKAEARDLRREIRMLERELFLRGIDPTAVEPVIDWGTTLAVDGYEPRYESNEDRRERAVEFFRRIG